MRIGWLFALCVVLMALPAVSGETGMAENDCDDFGKVPVDMVNGTIIYGNVSLHHGYYVTPVTEEKEVRATDETGNMIMEIIFNLGAMGGGILVIRTVQASLTSKKERALKLWDMDCPALG